MARVSSLDPEYPTLTAKATPLGVLPLLLAFQLVLLPPALLQAAPVGASTEPPPGRFTTAAHAIDELAQRAEEAVRTRSPLALARLYRLWNHNRLLERPARVRAALDTILATPGLDPLLSAHARWLSAQLLTQEGKRTLAEREIAELGLVTEVMMIGPFENSNGQGHDEAFPPEGDHGLSEVHEGKGHPVRWRHLTGVAAHGTIELGQLVSPSSEAAAYVLVVVQAKAPVHAALRAGASDQLTVFLDGVAVHAIDSRRPATFDQEALPLSLQAGPNLLLLKTSWVQSPGRVMFRLTRPDGGPLSGVTIHGDPASVSAAIEARRVEAREAKRPAPKVKGPPLVTVTTGVEAALAKARGRERAEVLSLRADLSAVLALFDRRKLPSPAEVDLEAAMKLEPTSAMLRFFYAHRAQERDPTLAHEELEAALAIDPGYVPALLTLAEMAKSSGRTLEAIRLLDAAVERDPTFAAAHVARASLRFDTTLDRDLSIRDLERAAGASPAASLYSELARLRRATEDRHGAARDAKRALELDFTDAAARSLLIGLAIDAGDRGAALEQLEVQRALYPQQLHTRLRRIRLLAGAPDDASRAAAARELAEAQRIFPDAVELPNLESELRLFAGDEKAALAALERSLELDPHQPEVRRHRGALLGAKQELEDELSIDALALARQPISDEERSWGAIFLADRTGIRLYENGQSSRFQQFVLRLFNPSFKDSVRVQRIPFSPSREVVEILSAERIRPSGETVKATSISEDGPRGKVGGMYVDRRFKTIVFDDVAEGDLIHVRYRLDSVGSNLFGGFFGDVADLQSVLPKRGLLYTVIAPKSRPLHIGKLRAKDPEVVEDGGLTRLTWAYDALPAIEVEPFSPPYTDLGTMVSVSTYETWADLGRWYARLFADQLELDEAAREAGRKVVQGAKDDAEKIRRLYDYVVKNTRYVGIELGIHGWKPFKAAEVHRRRYGDCKDKATLLAALLRDNGIDATITLVRTADRGDLPEDHATMWAFNHAITYVPSADLFLDGTAEFSGSRELPYQDQGGMALVVFPDGTTKLTRLPSSQAVDNLNESSYRATLARDGSLSLTGVERFHGARASALRQEMEEVAERKSNLEKQLNQVFNGVTVTEVELSDISNLEVPVEYRYGAQIARHGAEEQGRYVIPLTLFQHQVATAYGQLAARKQDLFSNHPWSTRNVVEYQLPAGAVLESLPEGQNITSRHVSLTQLVRRIPGGFSTDDTVTLHSRRVPAADYEELRQALLAIDRALGRKVVIRW